MAKAIFRSLASKPTTGTALLDSSLQATNKEPAKLAAWRVTVVGYIGVACTVLFTNVVIPIWTSTKLSSSIGVATVFTGDAYTSQPSIRNLATIPLWRTILWALLFSSSIPLHLLYNSVIFNTRWTYNYDVFAVTQDFLNGSIGHENEWLSAEMLHPVRNMQNNTLDLIRMSKQDCLTTYAQSKFNTRWRNLLVVTNASLPSDDAIVNAYSGN
ncbi:hypothetical protein Slin15195_G125650 [Septoria linicola]|uniref:DUF6536 domain-containing protein n=1 Tax=Septoria linicola TaxID=215465 RepID=A0A9Q9BA95_9PEZI|nr:hypothetical protein Slin14017_G081830 [Septoria linicola]USW59246.1 hypothetical protein Slin15195_G125650 [Septoria linicola]